MSNTKYIAFDFETGGFDHTKNPILTGYFAAVDGDLNVVGELELKIKPEAPYDLVEEGALKVNGIDLGKHIEDPETITRDEAGKKLLLFLEEFGSKTKTKPRPLGHNVYFDISFIPQLVSMDSWKKSVHYGTACTSVLTNILKDIGILPESLGNLGSLVKYFGVPERKAHTAKDDTLMMLDVYSKMVHMLKNTAGNSNPMPIDILSMLEK